MPNAQDLAFVQQATASGLAEVSEGQIAVAKSFNPAVRNFGQQMVTDHTAANNQLSAIAAQEHIPQSPVLSGPEQQDIVTLELLSDPEFTRTYSRHASGRSHRGVEAVPTGNQCRARPSTHDVRAGEATGTDAAPGQRRSARSRRAWIAADGRTVNAFISSLAPDLPRGSAAVAATPDHSHAMAVPFIQS